MEKNYFNWYLNNRCSRDMTRERFMFLDLRQHEGLVSFGSKPQRKNQWYRFYDRDLINKVKDPLHDIGSLMTRSKKKC
ncbi:hypothetical protein CR513_27345, partial [Mucuna pruriens]